MSMNYQQSYQQPWDEMPETPKFPVSYPPSTFPEATAQENSFNHVPGQQPVYPNDQITNAPSQTDVFPSEDYAPIAYSADAETGQGAPSQVSYYPRQAIENGRTAAEDTNYSNYGASGSEIMKFENVNSFGQDVQPRSSYDLTTGQEYSNLAVPSVHREAYDVPLSLESGDAANTDMSARASTRAIPTEGARVHDYEFEARDHESAGRETSVYERQIPVDRSARSPTDSQLFSETLPRHETRSPTYYSYTEDSCYARREPVPRSSPATFGRRDDIDSRSREPVYRSLETRDVRPQERSSSYQRRSPGRSRDRPRIYRQRSPAHDISRSSRYRSPERVRDRAYRSPDRRSSRPRGGDFRSIDHDAARDRERRNEPRSPRRVRDRSHVSSRRPRDRSKSRSRHPTRHSDRSSRSQRSTSQRDNDRVSRMTQARIQSNKSTSGGNIDRGKRSRSAHDSAHGSKRSKVVGDSNGGATRSGVEIEASPSNSTLNGGTSSNLDSSSDLIVKEQKCAEMLNSLKWSLSNSASGSKLSDESVSQIIRIFGIVCSVGLDESSSIRDIFRQLCSLCDENESRLPEKELFAFRYFVENTQIPDWLTGKCFISGTVVRWHPERGEGAIFPDRIFSNERASYTVSRADLSGVDLLLAGQRVVFAATQDMIAREVRLLSDSTVNRKETQKQPSQAKPIDDQSETGFVKWMSNSRGYGFIASSADGDLRFELGSARGGRARLFVGAAVRYSIEEGAPGELKRAVDVRQVGEDPSSVPTTPVELLPSWMKKEVDRSLKFVNAGRKDGPNLFDFAILRWLFRRIAEVPKCSDTAAIVRRVCACVARHWRRFDLVQKRKLAEAARSVGGEIKLSGVSSDFESIILRQTIPYAEAREHFRLSFAVSDDVLVLTSLLHLFDPLSHARISVPARGKDCDHRGVFDLKTFLSLRADHNQRRKCPHCSRMLAPDALRVDGYVADILTKTSVDVREVEVAPDGTWRCSGASADNVAGGRSEDDDASGLLSDSPPATQSICAPKRKTIYLVDSDGESVDVECFVKQEPEDDSVHCGQLLASESEIHTAPVASPSATDTEELQSASREIHPTDSQQLSVSSIDTGHIDNEDALPTLNSEVVSLDSSGGDDGVSQNSDKVIVENRVSQSRPGSECLSSGPSHSTTDTTPGGTRRRVIRLKATNTDDSQLADSNDNAVTNYSHVPVRLNKTPTGNDVICLSDCETDLSDGGS
eukprot:921950_1